MNFKFVLLSLLVLSLNCFAKSKSVLTTLENGQQVIGKVRAIRGDNVFIRAFYMGNGFFLARKLTQVSFQIKSSGIFSKRPKVLFENALGDQREGRVVSKFANGTVKVLFFQKEYGRTRSHRLQSLISTFVKLGDYSYIN